MVKEKGFPPKGQKLEERVCLVDLQETQVVERRKSGRNMDMTSTTSHQECFVSISIHAGFCPYEKSLKIFPRKVIC